MFKRNKNLYYFFYIYYVTQKITKQKHLENESIKKNENENLQKIRILSLVKTLLYLIKKVYDCY